MTTTPCPVCGTRFTPIRRQRFCRPACKQTAYRRAQRLTTTQPAPPEPIARPRRETTIYQCGECEQRYLAEQWCHDCNRPCTRIGPGGPCPHCDEPVAVEELLPTPTPPTKPMRSHQDTDHPVDTGKETQHAH